MPASTKGNECGVKVGTLPGETRRGLAVVLHNLEKGKPRRRGHRGFGEFRAKATSGGRGKPYRDVNRTWAPGVWISS